MKYYNSNIIYPLVMGFFLKTQLPLFIHLFSDEILTNYHNNNLKHLFLPHHSAHI